MWSCRPLHVLPGRRCGCSLWRIAPCLVPPRTRHEFTLPPRPCQMTPWPRRSLARGQRPSRHPRRHEFERYPVVAPTLVRGRRTVVEHVSLVTTAAHAVILRARRDELVIGLHREVT